MTSSTAKSAQRAFEILELFGERRTPLSVMDVVRALDYPQSSTSMLLKGLHAFGYLNYDSRQRRYSPTARVALLGAQITRGFFFSGDLAKLAYDLQARTGEEVLFGMQNRRMQCRCITGPGRCARSAARQPARCFSAGNRTRRSARWSGGSTLRSGDRHSI
jgi:hypothetical protein